MQADRLGLAAGVNLFGYVSARPISSIDPLGLCEIAVWSGGYIVGWRSCDTGQGQSGSTGSPDPRPQRTWPGHIDLPTSIPKDTLCYPGAAPEPWSPRDNGCYLACMGAGIADTAWRDAAVETGGHLAEGGVASALLKSSIRRLVPAYSMYSFVGGVRGANKICNLICR